MSFIKYLTESLQVEDKYPIINNSVISGLDIMDEVPNMSSIEATLDDYEILKGIRKVPMSEFGGPETVFYAKNDFDRSKKLAEEITENRMISPLIIVVDNEGPYILEGAHRYVALYYMGVKYLPAVVVIDEDQNEI